MNLKKQILMMSFTLAVALLAVSSVTFGQERPRTIDGTWLAAVTPRNCATGDPIPNAAFRSMFSFNKGGTMVAYGVSVGQSPATVSPELGVWKREMGWKEYSFAFVVFRYSATGVFIGSTHVRAAVTLGESGNELSTVSSLQILDANDVVIGTGCATSVATRFE